MPDVFQTNIVTVQKDANNIKSQVIKYYNEGNFDAIIKLVESKDYFWAKQANNNMRYELNCIEAIVYANRDNKYEKALFYSGWVWGGIKSSNKNNERLNAAAFNAGKSAWERVNGRIFTELEFSQIYINHF